MSKNLKLILFDYDGTIVDSEITIVTGIKHALDFYNYNIPSDEIIRKNIGRALLPVFGELTKNPDPQVHSNLLDAYREWYRIESEKGKIIDKLYEGAKEIIKKLYSDGYILGIATNKSKHGLIEGIERHEIKEFFTTIKTVHDCNPKPLPDMGISSMKEVNVNNKNSLMIGDTINDALMAKACEMNFIGVSWGFNDKETLINNGAIAVVNDFEELYLKINNNFK